MIDQKFNSFNLPRMRLTDRFDFHLPGLLNDLKCAKTFFAVFQDGKGNLKVIHSGLNADLYALGQTVFHRHIGVHDFIKLSLINVELFRNGDMNKATEHMNRSVEYINIKSSKNL